MTFRKQIGRCCNSLMAQVDTAGRAALALINSQGALISGSTALQIIQRDLYDQPAEERLAYYRQHGEGVCRPDHYLRTSDLDIIASIPSAGHILERLCQRENYEVDEDYDQADYQGGEAAAVVCDDMGGVREGLHRLRLRVIRLRHKHAAHVKIDLVSASPTVPTTRVSICRY